MKEETNYYKLYTNNQINIFFETTPFIDGKSYDGAELRWIGSPHKSPQTTLYIILNSLELAIQVKFYFRHFIHIQFPINLNHDGTEL